MSFMPHDPDECESVSESRPCTGCRTERTFEGERRVCTGRCNEMFSVGLRRRSLEDIARIKKARQEWEDDEVLRRAEIIRARRAHT